MTCLSSMLYDALKHFLFWQWSLSVVSWKHYSWRIYWRDWTLQSCGGALMDNRVKAAFSYVFGWLPELFFWPLKKRMNLYGKAQRSPLCWAFFCWRATFWCSGFPLRGRCCPAVLASAASCCGSSSSWKRFKTFIFACRSSVRFLKIMWCGGFCKNDCSGFLKSNRKTSGKRLFLKHLSETASFTSLLTRELAEIHSIRPITI